MRWSHQLKKLRDVLKPDQTNRRKGQRRLQLEQLEDRVVPTIYYHQGGEELAVNKASSNGISLLSNVQVKLVFWGTGWNNYGAFEGQVINAVQEIVSSPYLSGLSHYDSSLGQASYGGSCVITDYDPALFLAVLTAV